MRRTVLATLFPFVILTITLLALRPESADAAPAGAPAAATKFSIAMAIIEKSGSTFAERNVDVALGVPETTTVERKAHTVAVETTVTAGVKPGCYKIKLVVRERTIDSSGRFNKTVWESATEPCDTQPVTLGPKEEIRVRVAVKPLR